MRTVVIGHSFGGLIAYSALAQAELNELTLARTTKLDKCNDDDGPMRGGHLAPLWPDGLILINPAFEATRYESFDRLMKSAKLPAQLQAPTSTPAAEPAAQAGNPKLLTVPHIIVVASNTDHWTGRNFSIGRAATTLFEGYDRTNPEATRGERAANLHSIAYVDAYRTHTLDLDSTQPDARAVARLVPWMADKPGLESPVWVVMAADTVVHGHDGFLYGRGFDKKDPKPYLANWLIQLFDKDCTAAPEMAGCMP